jgi:hypothetical protein
LLLTLEVKKDFARHVIFTGQKEQVIVQVVKIVLMCSTITVDLLVLALPKGITGILSYS